MNRKNHLLAILAAVSFILATLTGCGGKTEPDVPQPTPEPVEYANLTDEDSRALLSRLLENAGIDETRIRGLFDRVDQFNASVKSEWLTNGFERAVPTDTKYDPYEMQDLWAEKNGDFPGYNCRITAFSLFGEFVTVGAGQPEVQGADTLFLDLETLTEDPAVLCGDSTAKFCALFAPVPAADSTDVDEQAIRAYYAKALEHAATLGVKSIVFGSAGAKRVPEGFDMDRAYQQVVQVTRETGEAAAKYGITIVIEPVRMPDCNIINTFAEGVQLAKTVGLDNVKVLIDFYHMVCEKENPEVLRKYGKEYLRHVHFSYPSIPEIDGVRDPDNIRTIFEGELHRRGWWRTFPSCREEWDYTDFIQALKDCGYQGRVSLEAPVTDFDRQAQEALAFMKAEL